MKRECSFWNKAVGPLGYFIRLVGLAVGIPVIVPVKQPDWYILQHEQIHFAIMQVAALQLTRQLAEVSPSRMADTGTSIWTRRGSSSRRISRSG